jgi:hypothetical protein
VAAAAQARRVLRLLLLVPALLVLLVRLRPRRSAQALHGAAA